MKILVTGGAGFIGSHLVDAFLGDGHEVAVVDSLETGVRANVHHRAQFFQADIRDASQIDAIFSRFSPEVVSHHAAQISVPHSVKNPALDAEINVTGSLNLWRAARDAGTRRFIFASSGGAVYGDAKELPVSEAQPPAPLSPYGLSKQVFEMYLTQMRSFGGPTPVILRYANVYGPRQGLNGEAGVVSIFVKRLLDGQSCTLFGDGSSTRDYIFVGDVVAANRLALHGGDDETFNIATTTQTSSLQLFDLVNQSMARQSMDCHCQRPEFAPERPGDVRFSCLDASKARRQLGWKPRWSLRAGIQAVIAHEKRDPESHYPKSRKAPPFMTGDIRANA